MSRKEKTKPKHFGPPPFPRQIGPVSTVVGRDEELSTIRTNYEDSITRDSDNPVIQIISAGAGMGKTDTAFEYARQNKAIYSDGTFFFFLESRITFSQSIRENLILIGLHPSENSRENFIRLQTYVHRHQHCLFIYDNMDDVSIVEGYLPASPLHILVTTRRSFIHSPKLQYAHILRLQPLQPKMAAQLLLTLCHHPLSLQQLEQDCYSEFEHALNVVGPNMLDGLPLGVVHAAVLINKQLVRKTNKLEELSVILEKNRGHLIIEPSSVEEWLRNYRLSGILTKLENDLHISDLSDMCSLADATIHESSFTDKEKEALINAKDDLLHLPPLGPWKMDIDSGYRDNKFCRPLFQAVSLLPSRDIPVSLLRSYLLTVCEDENDQLFDAACHLIEERSLWKLSEDGQSITIHPLIQQTMQQYVVDKNNERHSVLSSLSATLVKLLPSVNKVRARHKLTGDVTKYASHLYHVVRLVLDCQCNTEISQMAVDLACVLSIHMHMHDMSFAASLCFSRLTRARKSGNKLQLVEGLVDAVSVLALQHKVSAAHGLCQFALQLMSGDPSTCGYQIEQWALLMMQMADAYHDLGLYGETESLVSKTKRVLERDALTDHYAYARCLHKMASCHNANGRYAEAEEESRAALSVYEHCVSQDHPAVGAELANLGLFCIQQSKFVEAEISLHRALNVERNSLPAQHPTIVRSLRMMGYLYNRWGKYKEAERRLSEALEIIQSAYLTPHAEAGHVISLMGRCYRVQGWLTESEEYHRRAVKVITDLFGDHHRSTAHEYHYLGRCLYKQEKYRDAQDAFRRALDIRTNSIGRDHPDTAWSEMTYQSLYHLSFCFQDIENYQEALPLLQEAVEVMRKKRGDSNHMTLTMEKALYSLKERMRTSPS